MPALAPQVMIVSVVAAKLFSATAWVGRARVNGLLAMRKRANSSTFHWCW